MEKIEASTRGSILEIISLVPGIHLREAARALGLSLNTVRYHARILANSGLISLSNDGSFLRLFPPGTTAELKIIYTTMRDRTARKMLVALSNGQAFSNKEICQTTGLSKSTVSEHIQKLLQGNLVDIDFSSYRSPKIRLAKPELVSMIHSQSMKTKHFDPVQNYVDLWDF